MGALVFASAVGLLASEGVSATAAPKPPKPVPVTTQGDVNAARNNRDAKATQVGVLSAQIADEENQIQILQGKKEQAEQKYALARSKLDAAKQAEAKSTARLQKATHDVEAAHDRFVRSVQASYMGGDLDGTAGTMLTATDPNALLEQSALQQYMAAHKADAVGQYESATVARSNDQAAAKRDVLARQQAEKNAQAARDAAFAAVVQAQQQQAALEASKAAKQRELETAQLNLMTTASDRARYLNYVKQKKAYAAYQARQAELAAERAAAAAAAARARHSHRGGGGGGGGSWSSGPSAPSGGSWTAAKGRRAVNRAMSQLGVPYAWAGGGVGGPSYGVCDSSNGAPNDCNVRGYDCSGLAMYAWGQSWDHYAATQYRQAGSYHPSLGNLKPGDLLFWSFNGSVSGIHHVAIYKGGGQIIQAPESGSYVMVSSMYAPGSIFGATRPLS
jgi:cell wall-associated NlpC family hydrolase